MGLLDDLLGESPKIAAVREQVRHLVRSWSSSRRAPPVLIQGETGTGKGLVARALHAASPRADGPFVDFNCVSVPDTLLEAELFGYERGAFTDARQSKPGLFQVAHRGTLFLDEVGLLPPALQGKLLSVLESRTVRRLGATRAEAVDVWVLAATNENLIEATGSGRFREDLYHRLAVLTLTLPPLRERDDDAAFLAHHFLGRACADYGLPAKTLTADAIGAIRSHSWPGNVRQLSNVIERTALLTDAPALTAAHLELPIETPSPTAARVGAARQAEPRSARDADREHLLQVLTETGWNISRTAARLAIARNTVQARIRRYALQPASAQSAGRVGHPPLASPEPEASTPERTTGPSLHWQPERVSFLLIRLRVADESDVLLQPLLDRIADRVETFGGTLTGRSPVALSVVFRGERTHEPAVLAAHAAMVVLNAGRRDESPTAAPMTIGIGVHASELLVDSSDGATTLDADGTRRAWNLLDGLLETIERDTIAVSEAAGALLRRRFALTPLPPSSRGYRLDGPWHARPSAEREASRLVGRREEVALLRGRLALAARGAGQIVDLVGEAGIGKSRLLQELVASHERPGATYLEGRCSSATESTPLYPLLAVVRETCGITDSDRPDDVRERVTATCEEIGLQDPQVPSLLVRLLTGEPGTQPGADLRQAKRRFFEVIRQLLIAKGLAAPPLLVAIEDLHWVDPTSEECLASLVETLSGEPIFLLTTYRPGYRPPWTQRSNLTQLTLPPLSPEDSRDIVHGVVAPGTVPDDLVEQILARGDGNPFFLEELSRAALDKTDGRALSHVPATVHEVIALRIGRLRSRARQILGPAAVLGRDVPLHLLCSVGQFSPTVVEEAMEELERADLVHRVLRRGFEPWCLFRHALVQEVAYARLRADERRALHLRALESIEQMSRDAPGEHIEALAHHAIVADVADRAVPYLVQAAQKARARSAPAAELKHLNQALELLRTLPEGLPRDRQELTLQTAMGQNLLATKGYGAPEVERAYAQALVLCQRVGDTRQLASVLTGQWVFHLLRADYRITGEIAERLLALARADGHEEFMLEAHVALGMTAIYLGDFTAARTHLEEALTIHDPGQRWLLYGTHLGVSSLAYMGWALWYLGFPDAALRQCREALALARAHEQSAAFSVAQALGLLTSIHLVRGDRRETLEFAVQTIAYSNERGFPYWVAFGRIAQSWALAEESGWHEGIAQIREGVDRYRATGAVLGLTRYFTILAEMYRKAGDPGPGLAVLDEATALAAASDERYYAAEIHRLRGELTLLEDKPAAVEVAETCFLLALDVSREQRAWSWELRAASSLARLWARQDKASAACELLRAVHDQFTEGRDTADLVEARALLAAITPTA
jgi:DNA-binding NtrC family response regulator/predicted ATPase